MTMVMKKNRLVFAGISMGVVISLSIACVLVFSRILPYNPFNASLYESVDGIPNRLTAEEEKIVVFSNGGSQNFHAANGYSNGGVFDCFWRNDCVEFENGVMKMSLKKEQNRYVGAEYRSNKRNYGYGFYSVSMKAAKCSGVVSSFFTYTNRNGWDEIDIEFLGKDTTKIQFNYYTKGVGGHEYLYDLGFDGAADFHEYAFEWLEDSITWFVDGKAVCRVTKNIPTNNTQIMMNVWNAKNLNHWVGAFDSSKLPVSAEYEWIGFSAANRVAKK